MARTLSADAREKMLAAAQQIVLERGVDGFSVDAVAAESGVAKTTIYRHFASGNELLMAALAGVVDEIPSVDTGDLRSDAIQLMHSFVALASQRHIHQLFADVLARAARDDDFNRLHAELMVERKAPLRLALQRGIARGDIDPAIDIDVVSTLFEGPLVARVMHDRGEFRSGEIEQIVDLLLRAIAPPGTSHSA